jgi:hypothetical protein
METGRQSNGLSTENSAKDANGSKNECDLIQNATEATWQASPAKQKLVTTDAEFWLKQVKLDCELHMNEILMAIIEERTTEWCVAGRQKNGALYVDAPGLFAFKIYPEQKEHSLEKLWKSCPLYTADLSWKEWYSQHNRKTSHKTESFSRQKIEDNEFVNEIRLAFSKLK